MALRHLLIATGFVLGMQSAVSLAVTEGEIFPDVTVKPAATEGKTAADDLKPDSLKGKITIVNFWATWCDACKVEIGEMKDTFKDLLGKSDFNLAFVALDKDPSKAVDWFKANVPAESGMLSRLYVDPEFVTADRLGIDAFPMTLVIDRTGKIVKLQKGFTPGEGSTAALAKTAADLLK